MKKILFIAIFSVFAFIACSSENKSDTHTSSEANLSEANSSANKVTGTNVSIIPIEWTSLGDRIELKHSMGVAEVQKNPQKVVSFDIGAIDTFEALGLGDKIVGVPAKTLPKYLEKYNSKQNVGSVVEIDFEALSALKPDLILISGRQAKFYEKLNEIAPTVFVGLDNTNFVESFRAKVIAIASLYGEVGQSHGEGLSADSAFETVKKLLSDIEAQKALVDKDKKALVILTNANRISVFGPNSRFGVLYDLFGLSPADTNLKIGTHGNRADSEYILKVNPDYLFVVDRNVIAKNKETAAAALDNPLIAKTKAAQNGKIIYLDPELWYLAGGGGLISLKAMSDEVFEAIK
ncbi:enterochelin ABC transporter CeuBCDE, periplasmic substrate-binding protein [Campylobacter avium LMG 24591]|uniref:Enterochelin ABC transporter CeuBCDE, periplasmic substrate-binding protein n=1 Tax=Campylobacter avium LMG 24591 TaxID=522484 RepID=A0A222MYI9_9BACT|nr:siderophore ABC transporter substrate-binding protein [Campylobacter avium]ASQ30790.1 enterochelin ABC transporter CeuBCDE, periplasmic substrate-binding protein [Campylobacter avium LMG 24591]OYD78602.1 enterochelin ABC transporter CeuBCDE, periplasmic substrate-binding protein [Campylobacter avium]